MSQSNDLTNFVSNLSEQWDNQDFEKILNEIKNELAGSAVAIQNWKEKDRSMDGPGIYCFWYEGEKLELKDFKEKYLEGSDGLSISKPTSKWYNKNKPSVNISNSSIKAYSFYLGKRESVFKRISQHIGTINSSKSTYGMHLKRNHELEGQLYVGYWMLPFKMVKPFDKYVLQQVLTFLETELRNELAPWVGKQ